MRTACITQAHFSGSPISVLNVTLDVQSPPTGCPSTGNFVAYPNPGFQQREQGKCFVDYLNIQWDDETKIFMNATGVEVEVVNTASGTENSPLVRSLQRLLNYRVDHDLFVVSYDWRLSPNLDTVFIDRMRATIESAYEQHQQQVFIIAHSTGGGESLYFLQSQPQQWKDKFIAGFISLSGNFAGEVDIFGDLTDLSETGFTGVTPLLSRQFWLTQPAEIWQLPHEHIYGAQSFVFTPDYNYTTSAADILRLLSVLDAHPALEWYHTGLWNATGAFTAPQVNTYCLYGQGIKTLVGYVFPDNSFESNPQYLYGDGDGDQDIVTNRSCEQWAATTEPPATFYSQGFTNVTHAEMLVNPEVLKVIVSILSGHPPH